MRLLLALLPLLLGGCIFGAGIDSSPRECQASAMLGNGIRVDIPDPERFVGYCMELRGGDGTAPLLRKVPESGSVWFPPRPSGPYTASVTVQHDDDRSCADEAVASVVYEGGLVHVTAERAVVCA